MLKLHICQHLLTVWPGKVQQWLVSSLFLLVVLLYQTYCSFLVLLLSEAYAVSLCRGSFLVPSYHSQFFSVWYSFSCLCDKARFQSLYCLSKAAQCGIYIKFVEISKWQDTIDLYVHLQYYLFNMWSLKNQKCSRCIYSYCRTWCCVACVGYTFFN